MPASTRASSPKVPSAGPVADGARFAPPPRRRSLPLVAVGVFCAFAGALVFAGAHLRLDGRPAVLAVAREVAAGAVISEADLRIVHVSAAEGLQPVPAGQRSEVVGQVAAVDLAPGALLVRSQVGASAMLAPGEAVIGVSLKGAQLPAALRPGSRVLIVDTGGVRGAVAPNAASSLQAPTVLVSSAAVFAVPPPDPNGATVVSLVVPARDAPGIAAAAASERISLVLMAPPQS